MLIKLDETRDMRRVAVSRRADGRIVMRLTFVVGIYLPRGVDIVFDGERKDRLQFERCLPHDGGCIAEFDATPFLDRMKAGGAMTLAFKPEADSASNANVTIDGFAEALAALDALAPPPPAAMPDAAGTTVAAYGPWQMLCRETGDAAGARLCNIVQSAEDPAANGALTAVLVARPGKPLFMRVSVSGDVVLRPGLALAIDGEPQGVVQFDVCGQLGCAVQVELADIVAARFKAGKTATFTYRVEPDLTVAIPVALGGFGAALAALAEGGRSDAPARAP